MLLKVLGLQRSGNHAVIDWILQNAAPPGGEKGMIHFNKCKIGMSPLDGFAG
jgi:hypothetical protein